MKVLILGVTGMLGNCLFRRWSKFPALETFGAVRKLEGVEHCFNRLVRKRIRVGFEARDPDCLTDLLRQIKPDVVVNCVALIDKRAFSARPIDVITINSVFPHQAAAACAAAGARFIHISTDGVFDGREGAYREHDPAACVTPYAASKYLGEPSLWNCLTLRTSVIGHSLRGSTGLADWFLAQSGTVTGYRKAIYTGFPAVELANVMQRFILPSVALNGLYHLASSPISKYDLLRKMAKAYAKRIKVEASDDVQIDLSLDASAFHETTGYVPPEWNDLIDEMHSDYLDLRKDAES